VIRPKIIARREELMTFMREHIDVSYNDLREAFPQYTKRQLQDTVVHLCDEGALHRSGSPNTRIVLCSTSR
jgi:hypothetical protein